MLPYRVGGGLPGASLMTHSAGSVTTQRKAFKYVMASEPYRYTWYFKRVMASLPYIKIYFFKTLIALKLKSLWLKFSLIHNKVLGRCEKTVIFTKIIFCSIYFQSQSAWLFNHAVCKIGLRTSFLCLVIIKVCYLSLINSRHNFIDWSPLNKDFLSVLSVNK